MLSILQTKCSVRQRTQADPGAAFPVMETGWTGGNNLGRSLVFFGAYLCAWALLGGIAGS